MDYLRGKLRGKTPSWGRESEADTRGETEWLSYTNIFIPNTLYPPASPHLTLPSAQELSQANYFRQQPLEQERQWELSVLSLVQDLQDEAGQTKQLVQHSLNLPTVQTNSVSQGWQ